ncbi:FAD-binding oxidoreductase [Spongiactinospora rosea]|uniref:FAD-binding oxidoreductase n=1 Tax=Spongiactinospora rosea TaxID=2248750 RepID=A0A366LFC7_9ACTN|nr:FAD-binding protein [Spongiactinospora rosea]RBQ12189.1 FAD-binding oxidoreductase [Spongiactinospora rosea]
MPIRSATIHGELASVIRVLSKIRDLVGPGRVDEFATGTNGVERSRPNVGMYRTRRSFGVIRPATVDQVCRIVEYFDDPDLPIGLHIVSTGRNWGLGSAEPARDRTVTLDLSDLDEIRRLDIDAGFAIVEPGVTQGRLAASLAGTDRMLNVTASSAHTSIIGNGLDRGVGLRQQRVDDLLGLEVVLPDGQLVHVGWWPEEGRRTPLYPYGLGPSLLQLFVQSDLGVVSAAAVRLLHRPKAQRVIRLGFAPRNLISAVGALRRWVAQGLVGGVLKIYDTVSAASYGGSAGGFLAHLCIDGTERSVAAISSLILEEAVSSGLFTDATPAGREAGGDAVVAMVEGAYSGDPSYNDGMLEATLGQPAARVDEHGLGWLFFLPLVPFSGEDIARAHGLLAQVHEETGVRAGCTVNALNADVIDFVVTVKFAREERAAERAHRALDRAYELFSATGFMPYRLDIDHADWVDRLSPDPGARELVRRLKKTLDPNGAIARGRYS